ncbi:hypothetical protein [Solwaraspora sp. WMMD792]|uniref:hypothetical protein n=1 Tax=Solwaraspora sp. WMMD792 TaxID=3016099 RepID=UPI002415A32A|nr:hypothetical protein [Solwaraspora sp. WMMD792]MDG4769580.1 hypothetical protein [Solwaraspora sp. WMMD792]
MQWDAEYERVVAEYTAGRDVAELERQYDLSRAEIEWLVAAAAADQRLSGTTGRSTSAVPAPDVGSEVRRRTPPVPVIIAVAGYALGVALGLALVVLGVLIEFWALSIGGVVIGAIFGSVMHGLWQGRRGSLITAIILGVVSVPVGLILVVLLLVPASAQAWFAQSERTRTRTRSAR